MEEKRSWWQQIKQHRVAIGVVGIVCVVVIVIVIIGYQFDWTGFNGYNKITITHTISGTNAGTVTRTEEYQPGKGLWDWLQLLAVLAVPIVVGFGAVWFTTRQGKVADAENTDNQRETALQGYIDKMSELLLHEKLHDSAEEDEVRNVARVLTLTVLGSLDANRKRSVLLFLYESGLLYRDRSIIDLRSVGLRAVDEHAAIQDTWDQMRERGLYAADLSDSSVGAANLREVILSGVSLRSIDLSGSDLRGADLRRADLNEADLGGTILRDANLRDANLWKADLSDVDLRGADLRGANLRGAHLLGSDLRFAKFTQSALDQAESLKGTLMPDGSIHP